MVGLPAPAAVVGEEDLDGQPGARAVEDALADGADPDAGDGVEPRVEEAGADVRRLGLAVESRRRRPARSRYSSSRPNGWRRR